MTLIKHYLIRRLYNLPEKHYQTLITGYHPAALSASGRFYPLACISKSLKTALRCSQGCFFDMAYLLALQVWPVCPNTLKGSGITAVFAIFPARKQFAI